MMGDPNGGAIGGLRMLRLVRLLTFVKNVPQLRVIIAGLLQGMSSVFYIVMLLFLVRCAPLLSSAPRWHRHQRVRRPR